MDHIDRIAELLSEIVDLLVTYNEPRWAQSFRLLEGDYRAAPSEARQAIRALYGGMGSFSDLVLHGADGIPLAEENSKLDSCRTELYALCQPGKRY